MFAYFSFFVGGGGKNRQNCDLTKKLLKFDKNISAARVGGTHPNFS